MVTNENKFYVSYSKLDTYKKCPMQYRYQYLMKLEKKVSKRSLFIGEHIHKLIELFLAQRSEELMNSRINAYNEFLAAPEHTIYLYQAECLDELDDIQKAAYEDVKKSLIEKAKVLYGNTLTWRQYLTKFIAEEFNALGDMAKSELGFDYIETLTKIMGQYEYYYSRDNMKVLDLEHKKYSSLGNYNGKDVVLVYVSDAIAEVNGEQYLVEHKSYSKDPMTWEETWLNVQTALYVNRLNKEEGWNIKGVIWDNIKSVAPKEPNILKSGAYGKHYNTHTLFSFISCETIMEGPDAVVEAMTKLLADPAIRALGIEENYNEYLSRHVTVFNDNAVTSILRDSSQVIDTITRDDLPTYRNMGWASCNFCPYKELCQQEMLGNDTQELIDTLYDKRD